MISEEILKDLEKLSIKHESVKALLEEWKYFIESPYAETYRTIKEQIKDWNEQLKIKPEELRKRVIGEDQDGKVIAVDWTPGKVDLFGDKDNKEFERVFKYFCDVDLMLKTLESIRSKMSPEEIEDVLNKDIVTHKDLKRVAFGKTGS